MSALQRGDLVGVLDGRNHEIGVLLAIEGKRCSVSLGLQGRLHKLPMRQLCRIAQSPLGSALADRVSATPWCISAASLSAARPPRRALGLAWVVLAESGETIDLDGWFDLLEPSLTPEQRAAAWLWLQSDQLLFCDRQGQISARACSELKQLRQQRQRQRLTQQAQTRWHQVLQQRQPVTLEQLDAASRQDLHRLIDWASGNTEQPLPEALQSALRQSQCRIEPAAIRHLLVALGHWDPHNLPALRNSSWAHGFGAELEAEAAALVASAEQERPGDAQRRDLTQIHCVTIDDPDTEDLDDALGLEITSSGATRIWIHVADPGRLIAHGSPLDLEARRRATSLYLAEGILPMFPWELSRGPLSLRAGRRCAAWSIWVELADDGAVVDAGVQRSWIKPSYRLSYSDADELIELVPPEEAWLAQLDTVLKQRRSWRVSHGALLLDQPEGRIRNRSGSPELEITEPTSARLLVAEAMILAGAVVAALGSSAGLCLPYRSQLPSAFPSPAQLQLLKAGPVRHAALKSSLGRGITAASAAPHFSLGLEAYVQATSPIRRYGDLLVQRQLALWQQQQPPLDQAVLQPLLHELDEAQRQANLISRDDQRHWRQVWFEAHSHGQWQAEFLRWLRESDQLGLIWIENLAMELPARCPPRCEPGDDLLVKVHRVDPLQDCLQLRAHR